MKPQHPKAAWLIRHLDLRPHPEGGWYRESYRATDILAGNALPPRYTGERNASTAIYFLLTTDVFSALHRLNSDEVWHFYSGNPLTIHSLDTDGNYTPLKLGSNPEEGDLFQTLIPSGTWFGATVDGKDGYALVGCTVAPGFEFADFTMAKQDDLLDRYPQHAGLIKRLTHS